MAPRKVCHFHSFTQYLSENTSWEELDWLWAVLKPRVVPCSLIIKSLWIATWSTESWSLPRLPAWLCFFCKFLQSHQLHVWDFDLLSVVLWGVEISSLESVIFVVIVAGGAYGGAPAALLHSLFKSEGKLWEESDEKKEKGYWQAMQSESHSWSCTLQGKGSTGDRGHGADMLACFYCLIFFLVMLAWDCST